MEFRSLTVKVLIKTVLFQIQVVCVLFFLFKLAIEESLPVTPFSLLLGKHRHQQSQGDIDLSKVVRNHHEQDSPAVKEVGVTTVSEQAK